MTLCIPATATHKGAPAIEPNRVTLLGDVEDKLSWIIPKELAVSRLAS